MRKKSTLGKLLSILLTTTMLSAFLPATAFAVGEPPVLVSAKVIENGAAVELTFDKGMAAPGSGSAGFAVMFSVTDKQVTAAQPDGTDSTKIRLVLAAAVKGGEDIWLRYTPGTVASTDGGTLAQIDYQTVSNSLPHPILSNSPLPVGMTGCTYSHTFTLAAEGQRPYAFSSGGSLPNGVTLDPATGELSGTPSAEGSFSFGITVTDSVGAFDGRNFTITVAANMVCQIGGTPYATLDAALGAILPGQTAIIELLADISYDKCLEITDGRSITFALAGHTLTVTNNDLASNYGSGLNVTKGRVGYQGEGAFNVIGVGSGVRVYPANGDTASATVSSATNTSDSGVGAFASNGGSLVVNGSATGGYGGASASSTGSASGPVSSVVVHGNATGTASDSFGASAGENASVTINGTTQGGRYGAYANGSNSQVTISDDAIGTDSVSHGAHAEGSGVIHVTGNVQGGQYGVVAGIDSVVDVDRNVTVTAAANGWGVNAERGAVVTVGGNIIASGSSLGVFASGSTVTVDGAIQAQPSRYIQIFDTVKQEPVYFDGSPGSRTNPSTKDDYYTYSDSSKTSTVWVKVPSISVWPAGSSLTADGTTDTSTVLTWPAATGALDYAIYKNNAFAGAPGKTQTYTVTGLSPDTEYTFQVQAAYLPAGATTATWTTDGPYVTVRTKAPLPKAATPSATFAATDFWSGTLAGLNTDIQYSVNGGRTWALATGATMTIYNVTAANGIQVQQLGDGNTTTDSDIQTITVTQAAVPTGLSSANCTTAAQNDGELRGLTTAMEYKLTNAIDWISSTGNNITGLLNGTYYVRVKADGTQLASEETELVILPFGLTIIPVPVANSGLKWTGNEQIGVNDGTGYTLSGTCRATDVSLNGYPVTATLQPGYAWADGTTGVKHILWNIVKADAPAAPIGLIGVAPTTEGGSDGKITGTTATMEYANNTGFANAADCLAVETTGLTAGTYYVRMKASANHEAGAYATITVPSSGSYNPPSSDGGSGSSYTPVTPNITINKKPDQPTMASMNLAATVNQNRAATVTITEAQVKALIDAAKKDAENKGKAVDGIGAALNIQLGVDGKSVSVKLDEKALALLEKEGVKRFDVNTPLVSFSFDKIAIQEMKSQAIGTVTLTATPVTKLSDAAKTLIGKRPVYDLTVSYQKNGKTEYISDFKKGTVMLGIPYQPASDESAPNLYGVYVDRNGKPQLLTNSSYDNGQLIFGRNSLSTYGVGYKAPAPAFTDTLMHWAKDSIDFVASRGLISGTGATAFSPNTAITRSDFLMALVKLSGVDVRGYKASSFTDVNSVSPAMPYIEWALKNGVIQGIGGGRFGPDMQITREQMAAIMANYAKATGYKLPVSRQAITFADDAKIGSWAKEAVKALQQTGIIVGKNNNLFDPQASATRAEASIILRRFVELVIDEGTARGWSQNDAGQWQYINENGKLVTGWLTAEDSKYYFTSEGIMVSGKWLQIDGKWYYFYADGSLA